MPVYNMVKSKEASSSSSSANLPTIKIIKDMMVVDIDGKDRMTIYKTLQYMYNYANLVEATRRATGSQTVRFILTGLQTF